MATSDGTSQRLFSDSQAACERIIERLEDAWQAGQRPALEDYLPGGSVRASGAAPGVGPRRSGAAAEGGRGGPRRGLPAQLPRAGRRPRGVLGLVAAEFRLRRRREPDLAAEEPLARFPDLSDKLRPHLRCPDGHADPGSSGTEGDAATNSAGQDRAGSPGLYRWGRERADPGASRRTCRCSRPVSDDRRL